MKKFLILIAMLLFVCHGFAVVGIGERVDSLKLRKFIKGKPIALTFGKDSKITVLHFWKLNCKPCTAVIPNLNTIAERYKDKIDLIGVGYNLVYDLEHSKELGLMNFTIAADDMARTTNAFIASNDKFPQSVILGANGMLYWRGPSADLNTIVPEILENRYDLSRAIDLDKFNIAMAEATKKHDFTGSLKLIEARLKLYPNDLFLIMAQAQLYANRLNKADHAIEILNKAISQKSKFYPLHDTRLKIIYDNPSMHKMLPKAYAQIIENFTDQPLVLVQLSENLIRNKPGRVDLFAIYKIAYTAYTKGTFSNNAERGRAAINLSRSYFYMGMLEQAKAHAKIAAELQKGTPDEKTSLQSYKFYENALESAQKVNKAK